MGSETTVRKIYAYADEFANRNGMDYWEAIRNVLYGARRDGRIFHLETAMGRKLETLQEVTDHDDGIFVVETINKPVKSSPVSPGPYAEYLRESEYATTQDELQEIEDITNDALEEAENEISILKNKLKEARALVRKSVHGVDASERDTAIAQWDKEYLRESEDITHSPSPTKELTRDQIVEQILAVEVEELLVDCNSRVAHDLLYDGVRGIKDYTDVEIVERWNWLFAKKLGYCVSIS